MADRNPELPRRPIATGSSNASGSQPSAVPYRLTQRHSSTRTEHSRSPRPAELDRRRSSILSFSSFEGVTSSFTEDILDPRTSHGRRRKEEREVTHWHSTPLAFAILPAIGGLLFKNGSAFVTDVLLLGLAAIFMNWSIRLPWDWYYSAQALRSVGTGENLSDQLDHDEVAVDTGSSSDGSPKRQEQGQGLDGTMDKTEDHARAERDLRRQELLALFATFVFPLVAAYLLHVIRSQLSRPSTSLVSDYNLSIFLLAAEIRPCRQLVRLVIDRTLYLQRTVTGQEDPFTSAIEEAKAVQVLTKRLSELEARLSDHQILPPTISIAQKADVNELSTELRKRYEPRVEGLERAVRRYEKRQTTQTLLTEQRLQSLETRLQEALSLAAVAAQHSQQRGVIATLLETVATLFTWPIKAAWLICVWPLQVAEEVYAKAKDAIFGFITQKPRKRTSSRQRSGDESPRKQGISRKAAR